MTVRVFQQQWEPTPAPSTASPRAPHTEGARRTEECPLGASLPLLSWDCLVPYLAAPFGVTPNLSESVGLV